MSLPFPSNPKNYPDYVFKDKTTGDKIIIPQNQSIMPDGTKLINVIVFNFGDELFSETNQPAYPLSIPVTQFTEENYICINQIDPFTSFISEFRTVKDRSYLRNTFEDNSNAIETE